MYTVYVYTDDGDLYTMEQFDTYEAASSAAASYRADGYRTNIG